MSSSPPKPKRRARDTKWTIEILTESYRHESTNGGESDRPSARY